MFVSMSETEFITSPLLSVLVHMSKLLCNMLDFMDIILNHYWMAIY